MPNRIRLLASVPRILSALLVGLTAFMLLAGNLPPASAQSSVDNVPQALSGDSPQRSTMSGMLSAGEYGLAIQAARKSGSPDRWLEQIADSQQRQGAHDAAIATRGYLSQQQRRLTDQSYAGSTGQAGTAGSSNGAAGSGLGGSASGGQVQADFTSLINLIQTTVDPLSWEDNGGLGVITEYPNGVLIDAAGRLEFHDARPVASTLLDAPRNPLDLADRSDLAFVSLPRLEQEVRRLAEQGQPIPPSVRYLNGMYDLHYIVVDPDRRDLFLVGPAGPWEPSEDGIMVNRETGKAVMELDDLVVCLRNSIQGRGVLGCSIDPRPGQFQNIVDYLNQHTVTSEKQREALRTTVGPQDAVVFGVPQRSHAAQTLLTADYHMKLLAMGHVKGGRNLPSYLDLCGPDDPPSEIIRWWFTLGEPEIRRDTDGRIFEIHGTPLELKTENQLFNRERAREGSIPAQQFVSKFNRHFDALQKRFPLYGQLENLFELAIASQLIQSQQLRQDASWDADFLIPTPGLDFYRLKQYVPIREVELVVNHRRQRIRQNGRLMTQTITAISGGVDTGTSARRITNLTRTVDRNRMPGDLLRAWQSLPPDWNPDESPFRWVRNRSDTTVPSNR